MTSHQLKYIISDIDMFKLFLDNIPVAIAIFDENMNYLLATDAWYKDYNISQDNVIGKNHYDVFPTIGDEWKEFHRRTLAGEILSKENDMFIDVDGNPHYLSWTIKPWYKNDNDVGGIIMFTSVITSHVLLLKERIETENMLMQLVEDLERANKEIQQFAYIISHDLRAPLINLKGFSKILVQSTDRLLEIMKECNEPDHADEVEQLVCDKIPKSIKFINNSVIRMDYYTNTILELSRIGRLEINNVTVNVHDVVESIVQSLENQITELNCTVKIEPLGTITADKFIVDQVFSNIISNAVKYLSHERDGHIEIYKTRKRNKDVFHVKDNGIGIADNQKDLVFAPFRRATKDKVEGEGMGLAYTKALINRIGGEISFTSTYGKGTHFSFSLTS